MDSKKRKKESIILTPFQREVIRTYGSLNPSKKKVLDVWEKALKG